MPGHEDTITEKILSLITAAVEPLETKEIEEQLRIQEKIQEKQPKKAIVETVTRVKVLYRLNLLRGDGLIKGKPVGSGKGTWIWWRGELPR